MRFCTFLTLLVHFILQWNCRGIKSNYQDLQTVLRWRNSIVICLQETKLAPDTPCAIKGYAVFREDVRSDTISHGGVLLAVHHSLPARRLQLHTSLQAVAARVHLNHREVTVCSLYLPPGISLPLAELRRLLHELPAPVLIVGDFNAHSTAWGCDQTGSRGRVLEPFICDESLCVLNTGQRTHFTVPSGQTSALDLSLVSPGLAHLFTWSVHDDPLGSDHFPVWIQYQDDPVLGSRPQRWNLSKADWTGFQSTLDWIPVITGDVDFSQSRDPCLDGRGFYFPDPNLGRGKHPEDVGAAPSSPSPMVDEGVRGRDPGTETRF